MTKSPSFFSDAAYAISNFEISSNFWRVLSQNMENFNPNLLYESLFWDVERGEQPNEMRHRFSYFPV